MVRSYRSPAFPSLVAKASGWLSKNIPAARAMYAALHEKLTGHERIFTGIYQQGGFRSGESESGPGSETNQTITIVRELPGLLGKFRVRTLLDIPCGDCHWIRNLDLKAIEYVGGDVVSKIVSRNALELGSRGMRFLHLDLVADLLPRVDLVLCRDCLVHFSNSSIFKALRNLCQSQSRYLLTTTFVGRETNRDIVTGHWRPLNLQVPPFCLPPPIAGINENCSEGQGAYRDKTLALWDLSEIRELLQKGK